MDKKTKFIKSSNPLPLDFYYVEKDGLTKRYGQGLKIDFIEDYQGLGYIGVFYKMNAIFIELENE